MAKEKSAGIILYPEDIQRIKRSVKPQYQFAVIYALSQYALTGELPTEEELGEGGMVAFDFIFDKVAGALDNFHKTQQKRQEAAQKRWSKDESDSMQMDANACTCMQVDANECYKQNTEYRIQNTEYKKQNAEAVVVSVPPTPSPSSASDDRIIAFDGSDITEASQRYDIADSMIHTYGLVDNDQTRDALIEDLEKHGEMKMREALKKAALSNSRNKVSVAFYRAVLNNTGSKAKDKPPDGGAYMHRKYNDNDFKAMEVDLDAED